MLSFFNRARGRKTPVKTPFNATRKATLTPQQAQLEASLKAGATQGRTRVAATPAQVAQAQKANAANAANAAQKANAGVQQAQKAPAGTPKPGARMMSQQEAAQMQMDAARKSSRGMAKGGMVKANCGASVKPNGKAKK